MARLWFVVQTEPNRDIFARDGIRDLGITTHLPMRVHLVADTNRGRPVVKNGQRVEKQVLRPYFPGYQFASFDIANTDWPEIYRTPGVRGILSAVGNPYKPSPIRSSFVTDLMAAGRAGDGAIDPRAVPFPVSAFAPGSVVTVLDGPFAQFHAMVQWSDADRVRVLIDIFGRSSAVEMGVKQVARI